MCVRERMEDCSSSISAFCTQMRSHCSHLEASCTSIRSAVDHKPSSLPPSNLPSLLTTLINRVSSTSQEVGNLESKTMDTISFQELLGHCMEIYKQNEASICILEDRLKEFGYKPEESANGDSKEPINPALAESSLEAKPKAYISSGEGLIAAVDEARRSLSTFSHVNGQLQAYKYEEPGTKVGGLSSSFYPETLSLQDLGLSAAGLACLTQEESSPGVDYNSSLKSFSAKPTSQEASSNVLSTDTSANVDEEIEPGTPEHDVYLINWVEEDEYFSCPTWLKMQISLEDLNAIVDDMCEILANKVNGGHNQTSPVENYILNSEDLSVLSVAGTKLKPCLLFLVRLGRLRTGHENGATVYHIVHP